jgi:hypothetical protein
MTLHDHINSEKWWGKKEPPKPVPKDQRRWHFAVGNSSAEAWAKRANRVLDKLEAESAKWGDVYPPLMTSMDDCLRALRAEIEDMVGYMNERPEE